MEQKLVIKSFKGWKNSSQGKIFFGNIFDEIDLFLLYIFDPLRQALCQQEFHKVILLHAFIIIIFMFGIKQDILIRIRITDCEGGN